MRKRVSKRVWSGFQHYAAAMLLTWVLTVPSIAQQEQEPVAPEILSRIFDGLAQAAHGRFKLGGVIVDEQGSPIDGVTVEVTKVSARGIFEEPRLETETHHVNGAFSFDLSRYGGIILTFKRGGYYERKMHFLMPAARDASARISRGLEVPPQVVTRDDLRVILVGRGQPTELLRYGATLEYRQSGGGKVWTFDLQKFRPRAVVDGEDLRDTQRLPANCIYIVAERDPEGKVKLVQAPRPGSEIVETLPERVRLLTNDPQGGFLQFVSPSRSSVYFQMRTAPDSGYEPEVVLDGNYFADTVDPRSGAEDKRLHFFLKLGGKYGKGWIGGVQLEDDGSAVRLGCAFHMQADGSRNVETEPHDADITTLESGTVTSSVDTTPPSVTILGDKPATLECGSAYTDAGATATDETDGNLTSSILVSNTVNTAAVGTYTVTYSVSDAAGNPASATRTVNVVDTTAPQMSCPANMTVPCNVALEVPVSFTASATDTCDTNVTVACSPASGSGFRVGMTNVVCKAFDSSGNTNTCSFSVTRAALGFTGFLAPIGGADATGGTYSNPVRTFKAGSKIPVKFTASCDGTAVSTGIHTLQLIKWSNQTTAETPIDASPADAATTGNEFRWAIDHWQYVLDTAGTAMSVGTWELRTTLSDGSTHSAFVGIK